MDNNVEDMTTIEKFFGGVWNEWVHKLRYIIILVMVGWLVFAIIKAKDIGPLTENEEFLPDDNEINIVSNILKNKFQSVDSRSIKVDIYWGIEELNNDEVGLWDPSNLGEIKMDDKFTLSTVEAQQNIVNFCKDTQD